MGSLETSLAALPDAQSPDLHLSHPTAGECQTVWKLSSLEWTDALSLPQYLEESAYLTTVPLAKDGVMTNWILTDKISLQTSGQSYARVKPFASADL